MFSVNGRVSKKLPKPPELPPPPLPPRLLMAELINLPTSPARIPCKPEKNPEPDPDDDDDGRFVVVRVNVDPPKFESSP